MTPARLIAVGLIVAGSLLAAPGIVLLGVLSLATSWLSHLWSGRGLDGVAYERTLDAEAVVVGDSVGLTVTAENRKLLPLAWLEADDFVTEGTVVREHPLEASDRPGLVVLRNVWSLAPFERVRRRLHVEAVHRGYFRFETVRLSVADLFGRDAASQEDRRPATLIVRPRTVPVRFAVAETVPVGSRQARRGLIEDPSLFAGVRPFQQGDPRRRIHERATARLGRPVSKRYDPSTVREVVVALDIQTQEPYWLLAFDEALVEALVVGAASLARRLIRDGAACGLAVNAWTYSLARTRFLPPQGGDAQLTRIADILGRASSIPSVPFDHLLAELPLRLPRGAMVMTVSARDPATLVLPLRRLRSMGYDVRHVAMGPGAAARSAALRRVGIDALQGRLDPDWQTSDALVLAA